MSINLQLFHCFESSKEQGVHLPFSCLFNLMCYLKSHLVFYFFSFGFSDYFIELYDLQ